MVDKENREKDIFLEALRKQPEERADFILNACAGDEDLRLRIITLLRSCDENDSSRQENEPDQWSIAHYRVTSKIGAGGMGEVYGATDTKLSREVAIKVLPQTLSDESSVIARFEREAKVLASLNHPNIATIFGIEDLDDSRAIIMELVEGETLAERLQRGALPLDQCLRVFRQIAEALRAAHAKGVVHRDLKPGNIKFTRDGLVKVLDFGLAKPNLNLNTAETIHSLGASTIPGSVMGTPAYMSPEQTRGEKVDQRTDVWAYGCCLFESLTGEKPFQGKTISDVMAEVLKADPNFAIVPADTPAELTSLLRRCLEKESDRRLPIMSDIVAQLEETTESSRYLTAPSPLPKKGHHLLWGSLVAGILVLVTILALIREKPEEKEKRILTTADELGAPPAGMVVIPEGTFMMGWQAAVGDELDPQHLQDELPPHAVALDAFFMERFEVTKVLWDEVREWGLENGYANEIPAGNAKGPLHPVQSVTWYAVAKWCNARSEMKGLTPAYYQDDHHEKVYRRWQVNLTAANVKWDANGYRLPTEAEWERAARGGLKANAYPWGQSVSSNDGNFYESSDPFESAPNILSQTSPVGYYDGSQVPPGPNRANAYGLYDMGGNVWEWCFDWYDPEYYRFSAEMNPRGPTSSLSVRRCIRGGSWRNANYVARCAERGNLQPTHKPNTTGFRCVRSR